MPSSPTAAQSDTSRRNGGRSHGPASEEGKARSARNGTRHGLFAAELELTSEEQAHFEALRDDLGRRHRPAGAAEEHWVRQVAVTMLRRERLDALEMRVLDLALEGADAVREAGLPSPATVLRYRARLQRDHEHAMRELAAARDARGRNFSENSNPTPDMAAQLAQIEAEAAAAADRDIARLLAMRGMDGKLEPEPASPFALNRAQRRRLEARQRQAACG
ncbi:hypothetical protein SH611_13775 [Geminicoccaceae bacterium 1502E]|nr:hypothetical protein [Geminicoccaceae bacterium 1502E]